MSIFLSMISSIIIGFVWYGPLFGKKWMAHSGISMPEENPGFSTMIKPVVLSLIGAFLMTYTLSYALVFGNAYLGTSGVISGLTAAFWYWLGFVVPVYLSLTGWEGKSWTLFAIHTGYWLVFLLVAGSIISTSI